MAAPVTLASYALRRPDRQLYFLVAAHPNELWLRITWLGAIAEADTLRGGQEILRLLRTHPRPGLLTNAQDMHTTWPGLMEWLTQRWAPDATALGVQRAAMVLSAQRFSNVSLSFLDYPLNGNMEFQLFDSLAAAEDWMSRGLATD